MGLKKYFWDSYAVIEVIKGNQNYSYYKDEEVILTIFNLAEIYYAALRDLGEESAEEIYEQYSTSVIEITKEILKDAMKFKLKYKYKNLSYADVIGYIYALRNGLIFLTGDKEFEGLVNVEFVRK